MDDLDEQIASNGRQALMVSLAIGILACLTAIYIIMGITLSLKRIHRSLEAVADEEVAISISHTNMRNEIGMMARATQPHQHKIRERHAMAERSAAPMSSTTCPVTGGSTCQGT